MALLPAERRALRAALLTMGAVLTVFAALILVPGSPLHGPGQPTLANGRVLVQQPIVVAPAGSALEQGTTVLAKEPLLVTRAEAPARLVEAPAARWSQ